jgi:FixJ family two-component response regulator
MAARPVVLLVDDEPAVLEAFQLTQRRHYDARVARSGHAGLKLLRGEPGISVVISDMRMPEMDGASFLRAVREEAPDVVRLLLTGHADIEAAASAVNEGRIFRFLTKPCAPDEMTTAIAAAVEMHRTLTAERVLLQKTLIGAVKAVTNVLGLTNPMALGRTVRIRDRVRLAAESISCDDRWHLELAAMCSQLAAAALPDDLIYKLYHGESLSAAERRALIESMHAINRSLAEVPRLEPVTDILDELTRLIGGHERVEYEGARTSPNARLLHAIIDLESLEAGGQSFRQALAQLEKRAAVYGEDTLLALSSLAPGSGDAGSARCATGSLEDGMVLAEDLRTADGLLLLPRGFEITQSSREHIVNRFAASLPRHVEVYLDSARCESA